MNGEQNPVTPPTGWQFKPDDTTQRQSSQAPTTVLPPSIGSDAPPIRAETAASGQANQISQTSQNLPLEPSQEAMAQSESLMASSPEAQGQHLHGADHLEWAASDNTTHQKPAGWTAMLVFGVIVLAGLIYLLTRDAVSTGSVIAAALLYAIFSAHKPPSVRYLLDSHGIAIGKKHYPYEQFRSFSVVEDGPASNIVLRPLKRFMPQLTVHYTPELEDEVVSIFADRLPMEAYHRDAMDTVIKKLRF